MDNESPAQTSSRPTNSRQECHLSARLDLREADCKTEHDSQHGQVGFAGKKEGKKRRERRGLKSINLNSHLLFSL